MAGKWRLKTIVMVLIAFIILSTTIDVFAFDKERKGFILGFGLGPGFTSYSEIIEDAATKQQVSDYDKNKVALMTDFKIGYGFNNKLMIYWMSKVNWFGKKDTVQTETNPKEEDITLAIGIGGLGVTYFFKPKAPSLFVSLGAGISTRSYPFKDKDTWTAIGLAGSVGWEFKKGWSLEASAIWGQPEHDIPDYNYKAYFTGVGITINVMGY